MIQTIDWGIFVRGEVTGIWSNLGCGRGLGTFDLAARDDRT